MLFSTLSHLARFDKTFTRWQTMRQKGVHFADDFPYKTVQQGWSAKRKFPLPFLGLAQITLTAEALIIHAQPIPPQHQVSTALLNLVERSKKITYENLHVDYSETIRWRVIKDIRWHIARPCAEIGRMPPTTHYIALERSDDQHTLLLQATPPFADKRIELPTAQLVQRQQTAHEAAVAYNQTVFELIRSVWQSNQSADVPRHLAE